MNNSTQVTKVESAGGERWRLTVSRSLDGVSTEGSVVLSLQATGESPHGRLAAARAWAALGAGRLAAGEADAAIRCAEAGLAELGGDYRPPGVKDSTALKIAAARERIAQGHAHDGATTLLDMLENRSRLYVTRYADEVVE